MDTTPTPPASGPSTFMQVIVGVLVGLIVAEATKR